MCKEQKYNAVKKLLVLVFILLIHHVSMFLDDLTLAPGPLNVARVHIFTTDSPFPS